MRGLLALGSVLLVLAVSAASALGDSSFFEVDEEFHRRNRELLQDYENPNDVEVNDDDNGEDEDEDVGRPQKEPVYYSTEPCTYLHNHERQVVFKGKSTILRLPFNMNNLPSTYFQPMDPRCFTTTPRTFSWRLSRGSW